MANRESEEVKMLEGLIEDAASGKKIDLQGKPARKIVRFERGFSKSCNGNVSNDS